ncbi:MAG: tetratricopeptide repeat protein [Cyanobacteria bacterium P01_G01_bin.19]
MKESAVSDLSESTQAPIQSQISQCLQEIARNPNAVETYIDLGDLYARRKQWQQAQKAYRDAIAIDPNLAVAHRNLAKVYTSMGDRQKAADELNIGFRLEPNFPTPQEHYELARTLAKQQKVNRAIASYHRAINQKADFVAAYRSLGKLLMEMEKSDKAIALYRQGVEQNPQHAEFQLLLAQAYAKLKRWSNAIQSYQAFLKLEPNSAKAYCNLAQALVEIEKTAEAETLFKKAISLQDDYWQAYFQLGILWHKQKKWKHAILAYQKVNTIEPDLPFVATKMALVYRHLEQYNSAIACHRQAINNCVEASNLEAKIIKDYQVTLDKFSDVKIQHYYQYAKLLRARGRFALAIAAYQKTIELDPYFRLAYIDLQYTPTVKNQLDKLIEFYRRIVDSNPDLAIAWGNLGDALSQQDRVDEAITCYQKASYQKAIQTYPDLAKLDWKAKKEFGPDFIIAGASKSGTSSIYHYLNHHPQVLLSHKKEIDFYWKNFKRGIDWYLAHFPSITDRADFLTGEATPNYLRFPHAARRIKQTFPQTKIIILLRNPADRAISWHYHKFNTGLTNEDLGTAVATEMERLKTITPKEITKTSFHNPDNIISSLYLYKLRPWINILGREQFLILKSEDFYQDPAQTMSEVHEFLGLPEHTLEQYPKVNAGTYNEIDSSLRATLIEYFAPYNQELEKYLGMKFDWK